MMPSRWASDPKCSDCPRRKTAARRNLKRCATCERTAKKAARTKAHGAHIEATYGITAEEYRRLKAYQAGVCAVCCRATGASRALAVDHDHACKAGHPKDVGCPACVRGLCCSFCNRMLGQMRDDPAAFDRAARYLRDPPFQKMRPYA